MAAEIFASILASSEDTVDEKEMRCRLSRCCVAIHQLVIESAKRFLVTHKRHYYVTPASYMDLMKTYDRMIEQTRRNFLVRSPKTLDHRGSNVF
jgi:hypothetical protein